MWFHFLLSRSLYRLKSWQSLYLKAISRNDCCFSVWLNTNKSYPLYPLPPLPSKKSRAMPVCTDKRVDYLPRWPYLYDPASQDKASIMQWMGLIEADTVFHMLLASFLLLHPLVISVIMYNQGSPALLVDFLLSPVEVKALKSWWLRMSAVCLSLALLCRDYLYAFSPIQVDSV